MSIMPSHSIGIMFHGTTKGSAHSINPQIAKRPKPKSISATAMPKGSWMASVSAENKRLRPSEAKNRSDPRMSANQSKPTQCTSLSEKMS